MDYLSESTANIEYNLKNALFMAYTKTAVDNLPVTSTSVGVQPCLNSAESPKSNDAYPLEIRQSTECSEHLISRTRDKVTIDDRFVDTGL